MKGGWKDARMVGWRRRLGLAALLLSAYPPIRLSAQVGFSPTASPFRDIRRGGGPVVRIGFLSGQRGDAGVGQSSGMTYGLRYTATLGGPTSISLGFAYAATDRFVVDPLKDSVSRKSGPYADDMALVDLGLEFLLTGAKTWRGIAPYLSASMGLAISNGSPAVDTSGYKFGTKFTIAPGVGLRWYPSRRLTAAADLRAVFWRLRYPTSFKDPSPVDSTRVIPLSAPWTDWTTHPWISVGVGWIF